MKIQLNKSISKTLKLLILASLAIFMNACSFSSKLPSGYASIENLQGAPMRGQMPTVKVNGQLILSKTLTLPAGKNHIEVKYYIDTAKPLIKVLSFNAKSGHCYELEYANNNYRIKSLGRC